MVGVYGDYIGSMTHVSCSFITIVGKGNGKTTILGGFYVNGKQNVKIEQLSATNGTGHGLVCKGSGTNVDVTECCFKLCQDCSGMWVGGGATATASHCEFTENGAIGVYCRGANTKVRLNDCKMHHNAYGLMVEANAVVDLHGTKTDIHSNKSRGIYANRDAKVNIHLPSQHNTTHDNVGDNRVQRSGGSIANINDGTFTHVVADDDDDN
jgi:hypothetical protein